MYRFYILNNSNVHTNTIFNVTQINIVKQVNSNFFTFNKKVFEQGKK